MWHAHIVRFYQSIFHYWNVQQFFTTHVLPLACTCLLLLTSLTFRFPLLTSLFSLCLFGSFPRLTSLFSLCLFGSFPLLTSLFSLWLLTLLQLIVTLRETIPITHAISLDRKQRQNAIYLD